MTADPLAYLGDDLRALREAGVYRRLRVLETEQASRVRMDGHEVVTLSTNNYLGLTTHPRLREAAARAVAEYGVGSGAVRPIAGTMTLHEELERRLAVFKQVEATLTLQSGFTANLAVIPVLVGEGDVVISDELNHASIIDGIRLSRAERRVYPHRDLDALERLLAEATGARRRLVVTDGVFSMDGDIAPLPGIVERAERHGAIVMVDDAHASGVLGRDGRGTVDHFGLHGRVHVQVGTLSKAIGAVGGYVAGSRALRDVLIHRARPFLFSTSHPPSVAASCIAALDVLESEPERLERLWANTRFFKAGLRDLGFDTGASETPITPVIVGGEELAVRLSEHLWDDGVFAQAIVFPMVPHGRARVRTIVTAGHSTGELSFALERFGRAGRDLGILSARLVSPAS